MCRKWLRVCIHIHIFAWVPVLHDEVMDTFALVSGTGAADQSNEPVLPRL